MLDVYVSTKYITNPQTSKRQVNIILQLPFWPHSQSGAVCTCYTVWKVLFNTCRYVFLFGTPWLEAFPVSPSSPQCLTAQHSGQRLMESFRRAAGRCCGLVLIDPIQPTDTSISHSTQWDRNNSLTPLDHQLTRRGIFLCEGFSWNAALKMREWGAMNGEILERIAAPGMEGSVSRGCHC